MADLVESSKENNIQKIWLHDTNSNIKLRGYINWGPNAQPNTLTQSQLTSKYNNPEERSRRQRVVIYVGNYHSKLGGNSHHIVTKSVANSLSKGYCHNYSNTNQSFGDCDVVVDEYAFNNDSDDDEHDFTPVPKASADGEEEPVSAGGLSRSAFIRQREREMEREGVLKKTSLSLDAAVVDVCPAEPKSSYQHDNSSSVFLSDTDDNDIGSEIRNVLSAVECPHGFDVIVVRVNLRGHTNTVPTTESTDADIKHNRKVLQQAGTGSNSWLGVGEEEDVCNVLGFLTGSGGSHAESDDGSDDTKRGYINVYSNECELLNRTTRTHPIDSGITVSECVDILAADHVFVVGMSFSSIILTNSLNRMYTHTDVADREAMLSKLRGVVLVSPPYTPASFPLPQCVVRYNELNAHITRANVEQSTQDRRRDAELIALMRQHQKHDNKNKNSESSPASLFTTLLEHNNLPPNFLVGCNVLMLHGENDQVTGASKYKRIFDDVDSHYKFLLTVPDSDHFYGRRDHLLTTLIYTYIKTSLQYHTVKTVSRQVVDTVLNNHASSDAHSLAKPSTVDVCYFCHGTCRYSQTGKKTEDAGGIGKWVRHHFIYNNLWVYLLLGLLLLLRQCDFGDEL